MEIKISGKDINVPLHSGMTQKAINNHMRFTGAPETAFISRNDK